MVTLIDLWLPIVLSSVAVFAASSIIHMVLTYHKSDYSKLPGEDEISEVMRTQGVEPGYYTLPHSKDMKEMGTPEMVQKLERGPVGILTIMPNGLPNMGKLLGLWFTFSVIISIFVAYLTGRTLDPGTDCMQVFRIAATTAFLGYSASEPVASIWKAQPWSITCKHLFDGLIYALVTGSIFCWLWPA